MQEILLIFEIQGGIASMALDRAIGNSSWSCCGRSARFSSFPDGCPSSLSSLPSTRFKSPALASTGLLKVVAVSANDSCNDPVNKSATSKRAVRTPKESQLVHEASDRLEINSEVSGSSLSRLQSAAGRGKAAVLGPSDGLSEISNLRSDKSASLLLADTVCADSGFVTDSRAQHAELLRVAVDVDEVLGSFLASLNVFIAERHSLNYDVSEYSVYDFMKVWRCSQAEANDRVHAFFESEHFKDGILPIPGAHESLIRLTSYCHLVVVTSRQHVIRKQTLNWLERHYSGIFGAVYFGNHFALEGKARPKSEICRSIGAQILIDDNPRYAVECATHGIEVLLFDYNNCYPWSKTSDGPVHPLITRVQTWKEIENFFFARIHEKRERGTVGAQNQESGTFCLAED